MNKRNTWMLSKRIQTKVVVTNLNEATLHVRHSLNCEKRRNYKFDIAAVGCDGRYSDTAVVHITVMDINEYLPVFEESSYVREVEEGRLYKEIVRVKATDRDCTPKYGDVCKYEILTADQPFLIDNEGVIRNTEPLDYERSHNHILSVVAYDCGMRQSVPVMVTIKVNRLCNMGWTGVAERVDYPPGGGALSLFPSAALEECTTRRCAEGEGGGAVQKLRATVTLRSSHIGKGCDRDTYSVHSQRRICGASSQSIDLLPSPGVGSEWTKTLKTDEGHESDQIFSFDGMTTAAIIPESVLNHSLASTFSISTWMKHADHPEMDKHRKEHIICLADDHKMNRHHYALFVRNCRLILLLRRDFTEGDLNIFRPAEWRWKIPQVCDNEWHHYSVNMRFPNVELYVDGRLHHAEPKNPEVIDDWPLHPTKDITTTLTVGGCWQGSDGKMKHYMKGSLAGLNVLLNAVEGHQQLKCLAQCREGLSLAPELYLNSVVVEGGSVQDLENLLHKVTYTNSRMFPTPGRRNVHIATSITCDNGRNVKVRPAESYIMVMQPQTPTILINGTTNTPCDYSHFRASVGVFSDVSVSVLNSDGTAPKGNLLSAAQKLDSCVVSVYPALNPDHEALAIRGAAELPLHYDIRATVSRDGVILGGADSVDSYQKVLHQIDYTNKKPAYYLNRVFKLTCSELNGRFTSNEYVQTLTVIHPHLKGAEHPSKEAHIPAAMSHHTELHTGIADKLDPVDRILNTESHGRLSDSHSDRHPAERHSLPQRQYVAHAQANSHNVDMLAPRVTDANIKQNNHVALLIGVVCVGFLVLGVVVGAVRARRSFGSQGDGGGQPTQPVNQEAEMAWDDSALTITVNPMETNEDDSREVLDSSDGDSCSDSDSDCQHDSSDDEDNDVIIKNRNKYKNVNQLEWDNSTM
ncbi:calsyntenin-1-like [Arctopsyche grandis]|uniref:calsyntenin-1-like n=1 Tax=Arctopsyche grandis TaxID=121162 RepID=UPI00406D8E1E